MPLKKLKAEDVKLACALTQGNISRSAERLGVWRYTLQKFLHRHPKLYEEFRQWRQQLIDEAEQSLAECVRERQGWAISLVLKSKNVEDRGWHDGAPYMKLLADLVMRQYGPYAGKSLAEVLDIMKMLADDQTRTSADRWALYEKPRAEDEDEPEWTDEDEAPDDAPPVIERPPDSIAWRLASNIPTSPPDPVPSPAPTVTVEETPDAEAEKLEAEVMGLLAEVKRRLST
jgi:hypothetical protein